MSRIKKIRFGLVGKNISYSFSKGYFAQKFADLRLNDHVYENYDLQNINEFKQVLRNKSDIKGLNVTIPYKEVIIPFLDSLDERALKIGAVNTIQFINGHLKGYNTDAYGFQKALEPNIKKHHTHALILGTGGASKAIAHVLGEMGITYVFVSRNPKEGNIAYNELTPERMGQFTVVINCTPLGTFPNVGERPNIPYHLVTEKHLFFDLIYNPEKTAFLKAGESRGANIVNGLRMLELQADCAWEIWQEKS